MSYIDINCDMGEGMGNEEFILPYISAANIACGCHAGDEQEMKKVIALCLQYNVAIGAHPSFPNKENFGRASMNLAVDDIRQLISKQLETLNSITEAMGGKLNHVKPHGALYNMAASDIVLARTIAQTIKDFNSGLIFYGLAGSVTIQAARESGLRVASEAFADRAYQPDGSLTPRTVAGALINDSDRVVDQVIQLVMENKVTAVDGGKIPVKADTICIHGDGANAIEFAKKIFDGLARIGTRLQKL